MLDGTFNARTVQQLSQRRRTRVLLTGTSVQATNTFVAYRPWLTATFTSCICKIGGGRWWPRPSARARACNSSQPIKLNFGFIAIANIPWLANFWMMYLDWLVVQACTLDSLRTFCVLPKRILARIASMTHPKRYQYGAYSGCTLICEVGVY